MCQNVVHVPFGIADEKVRIAHCGTVNQHGEYVLCEECEIADDRWDYRELAEADNRFHDDSDIDRPDEIVVSWWEEE